MIKQLFTTLAFLVLALDVSAFNGVDRSFFGKKYPYEVMFPKKEPEISTKFLAPSPGGDILGIFSSIEIHMLISTKEVFRINGVKAYADYQQCDNEMTKLKILAEKYYGKATPNKYGTPEYKFGTNTLSIMCGIPQGSPHTELNITIDNVPLIQKQIEMQIERELKH